MQLFQLAASLQDCSQVSGIGADIRLVFIDCTCSNPRKDISILANERGHYMQVHYSELCVYNGLRWGRAGLFKARLS